ncbi:MAG TPA: hypothetical protein VF077_09405 [Nitrospiraceae bacterium]
MADWSAYTTYSGGDNGSGYAAPGTIAYEGIGRDQDSSTQYMRSIQNLLGKTGKEATESGVGRMAGGDAMMAPVVDYFKSLMGGDRAALEGAVAPEIDAISDQYSQIRKMFGQKGGRGGGQTAALSQLPTQQTGNISSLLGQARKGAAGQLGAMAGQQQTLGLNQQTLGGNLQQAASDAVLKQRNAAIGETGQRLQFVGQMANTMAGALL